MKDWTTAMTVVFIAVMAIGNFVVSQYIFAAPGGYQALKAQLYLSGQPLSVDAALSADTAALYSGSPIDSEAAIAVNTDAPMNVVGGAALLNSDNPLSNVVPTRGGVLLYTVQSGDSASIIAANFGISLNTLIWANTGVNWSVLRPGQQLTILPVNGVLHQIQDGETLDSIAALYDVSVQSILHANPGFVPSQIATASSLIIPGGRPVRSTNYASLSGLPSLPGYFSIPTTGWNGGRLYSYNAVDITNACGTPVYAAAEGLVVEVVGSGWNGGYGNYILIDHPNGTKTRYAHTSKNLVSVGDYVAKGKEIALTGDTGQNDGPSGCNLHFEVYGAKNPFAK
ncbi:M23 family metallopeptidase [Patescibacteria group bacterium]|nr:M23 family metallopeptidase [Patescibacteria group bacterium]